MRKQTQEKAFRIEKGSYLCGPNYPLEIRAFPFVGTLPPDEICDTLCRAVLEARDCSEGGLAIRQTDDLHDTWEVTVFGMPVMSLRDQWTHYQLWLYDYPELPVTVWMQGLLGLALQKKLNLS